MKCVFQLGVITDEITQDFGRACEVGSREFGMEWVELRELWGKNLFHLDENELAEARRIVQKMQVGVNGIASPLFKVDWPGAPRSKFSPQRDEFNAKFTFEQQQDVLEQAIRLAKNFGCKRIRCFDFWRLDDQTPYRAAMNDVLQKAADRVGREGLVLVLENEMACNTATGAEAGEVLAEVKSPHFLLVWDPGNAAVVGESSYPEGYAQIPVNRIGHCHCKNVQKKTNGEGLEWAPVVGGTIDWTEQFRALLRDGYRLGINLETHWRGAGTPEESSRQSWQGMKDALARAGALQT